MGIQEYMFLIIQTKQYISTEIFVKTGYLEQHLDDTCLRIYDCSVSVQLNQDPEQRKNPIINLNGSAQYAQSHITRTGFTANPGVLSCLASDLSITAYD